MDNLAWRHLAADALTAEGLVRQAAKLRECRNPDDFSHVHVCSRHPEHYQRRVLFSCDLRICPACNEAKVQEHVHRYLPVMHRLFGNRSGYSFKFITFTTPVSVTSPDANAALRWTAKAVGMTIDRVLRKQTAIASRAERAKGELSLKAHGIGYILGAEFGETGLRLHHHVTYFGPDLPHAALVDDWTKTTRGLAHGVRIDRIYTRQELPHRLAYTTKVTRFAPEYAPDLFRAFDGARRVRAAGVFHGIGKVQRSTDERCPMCSAPVVDATRRGFTHWQAHEHVTGSRLVLTP